MNFEICVVCGQPLGHKPLLGEYVMHPKCQESVLQYVEHYDEKNKHLVERIEELENILKTSSDLQDKLLVKALEREREMSNELYEALQNCIAWWGPDYDYAQKVMQKFEDHKKMFHDND